MTAERSGRSSPPAILPFFGLSLGVTLFMLTLFVLIPVVALLVKASSLSPQEILSSAFSPRAIAAYRVSLSASLFAAFLSVLVGGLSAWVLTRYSFPGRRLVDSLVDLPFALPTSVAGIALTALYSPHGLFGSVLERVGISVAYTWLGIVLALAFVGTPFVVRTLQPVLEDLEPDVEEAAAALGASRWMVLRRIILPPLYPAMLTGFSLAFARGLGEYGSVIFIAGNMPMRTEIAPLLIVTRLEEFDYGGAAAIALLLLVLSLLVLLLVNALQAATARRQGGGER
jgi:sulfate transport system permease protein